MKLFYFALSLSFLSPFAFGAKAVITYRNKEYNIVDVKNDSVVIRVNNKSRTLKPESVKIAEEPNNRLAGVTAELNSLLVTLQSKGTRALHIEAEFEVSRDLRDAYLILVSGSSNDVSTVARVLPHLTPNTPTKIAFTIKTNKFTKMEPYQLSFFSGGKSIQLKNGEDIVKRRITPYNQVPRALFQGESVFPESLKSQFSRANVWMEFVIDIDGRATEMKALESPHELFTKGAIESLERSRFAPRYVKGVPQPTRIKQAIVFRNSKPPIE